MTVANLDYVTFAIYAQIGSDIVRFVTDDLYRAEARQLVAHLLAARCDIWDVLSPASPEHERRTVNRLALKLMDWHRDVEPLW